MRAAATFTKAIARLGTQVNWPRAELLAMTEREIVATLRALNE